MNQHPETGVLAIMSTTEGTEPAKIPSRRERAFLGELSEDFLRVETTTVQPPPG